MNEHLVPKHTTRSAVRRARIGLGLVGVIALAAACFPDPGGSGTTTTTTTTTEAPTTTDASTTTEAPTTTTTTSTTTTTAPVVWNPQITVSKTAGLEGGDIVTVTGTGFDPDANVGTRPPLGGQKSGVYVTFGKFADAWRPSAGAASGTRQIIKQVWALPQASYDALGGAATAGLTLLNADGTFTAQVQVAPTTVGTNAYGFAVYPGSGAVNADQELLVRATFAPELTVSKSTDLSEGETVTVSGIGFLPSALGSRPPLAGEQGGVYVVFGKFGAVWQPSTGASSANRQIIKQVWALPATSYTLMGGPVTAGLTLIQPDGSFTTTIDATSSATGTNPYAFAVYPGSGAVNAAQEILVPTTFAPAG